jgi:hypothetical protein
MTEKISHATVKKARLDPDSSLYIAILSIDTLIPREMFMRELF